jgi:hypothetical protein
MLPLNVGIHHVLVSSAFCTLAVATKPPIVPVGGFTAPETEIEKAPFESVVVCLFAQTVHT